MTAAEARARTLGRLTGRVFDVVVVGGGIAGASIARDAALRGLSVALLERDDIASGTSSGSTKLAHGGVRYLQQGRWRLVRESCRERDILRTIAPGEVRPLEFLYPVTPGRMPPGWMLHLGLSFYDRFAGNGARATRHRMLRAADVHALEPLLRADAVRGAALYADASLDDARLTLLTARSADALGAVIAPRVEVESAAPVGVDDAHEIIARDRAADAVLRVRTRFIVNAAGPWVREVAERLGAPLDAAHVRLTQGVHLVVPHARLPIQHAIVLHAPSDGRLAFAIPWLGVTLVGTTDTDVLHASDARARGEDVRYLLETARWWFPDAALDDDAVQATSVAVRALVASGRNDRAPSEVSREHAVIVDPRGIVSLVGGKLTGARAIAEDVVDRVASLSRARGVPVLRGEERTARTPLVDRSVGAWVGAAAPDARLAARWGSDTQRLQNVLESRPDLRGPLLPDGSLLGAEVLVMAEREWAMSVEDVLARRTRALLLDARNGRDAADGVAGVLAEAWGWSEERGAQELAAYEAAVARTHAWRHT